MSAQRSLSWSAFTKAPPDALFKGTISLLIRVQLRVIFLERQDWFASLIADMDVRAPSKEGRWFHQRLKLKLVINKRLV